MVTSKIKEKYPCGYEYEIQISGFFVSGSVDNKNVNGCPLHGKNCGVNKKKK